MLKYVERLLEYQRFKFRAINQTARLLAKGNYRVLQRGKSIAINNLFLPEDVLLEILARLPVKSLLCFRSVCKSWRDIIKDQTFITKHRLTQVALKDGKCVFVKINCLDPRALGCLVEDEQGGIKFTGCELPFLKDSTRHLEVAGPCNGIFIISDEYDQLFLWNPATREYKALPPSPEMLLSNRISRVGFGIDPISKDYKVVMVWHYGLTKYDDKFIGKVEVMSLSAGHSCRPKSETWKTIDAVPSIGLMFYGSDNHYVNGKYYWVVLSLKLNDPHYRIVWFDMGAEVFGLIDEPYWFASFYDRITVVKGSLALIRRAPAYTHTVEEGKMMFEIWIMDDYPWTKYATIPLTYYQEPFGFWKNQEVFLVKTTERDKVFSYDIKTNVIKEKIGGLHQNMTHPTVRMYTESLISFMG